MVSFDDINVVNYIFYLFLKITIFVNYSNFLYNCDEVKPTPDLSNAEREVSSVGYRNEIFHMPS